MQMGGGVVLSASAPAQHGCRLRGVCLLPACSASTALPPLQVLFYLTSREKTLGYEHRLLRGRVQPRGSPKPWFWGESAPAVLGNNQGLTLGQV